jgi:hypothetical protein
MLRDKLGIIGSHRELIEKVLGNIGKVLETSEIFWTLSEMFQ